MSILSYVYSMGQRIPAEVSFKFHPLSETSPWDCESNNLQNKLLVYRNIWCFNNYSKRVFYEYFVNID